MAAFDFDAALRWFRIDPQTRLRYREDSVLPFALHSGAGVQGLVLDTCVYIDQLRGRLPEPIAQILATRQLHHSTVAIQELMFGIGVSDPTDPRRSRTVSTLRMLVKAMRPHRTFAPDPDLLARAALLSGLLCRTQNYGPDRRMRALMDATLFLQGQKLGLMVVTRNIGDFDLLLQLVPTARVQMYRTDEG